MKRPACYDPHSPAHEKTSGGTYLLGAFNSIGDVFTLAAVLQPVPSGPSVPAASTFALIAIAAALAVIATIRLR